MSSKMTFDINETIGNLIQGYVQTPDYSALREELETHSYAKLKHHVIHNTGRFPDATAWYKILFVTTDCVIVQDVLLRYDHNNRFGTYKIELANWENVFSEWIDEEHDRYEDCHYEYQMGMRSLGVEF